MTAAPSLRTTSRGVGLHVAVSANNRIGTTVLSVSHDSDFRQAAYSRYVSTFKKSGGRRDSDGKSYYARWCARNYGAFFEEVPRGGKVLDLGCGPGELLQVLVGMGLDAEGIDISAEQVAIAKEAKLRVRVADAFAFLEACPNEYDGIIAVDFLEHFTRDEILEILAVAREALKPGGVLLLQTPNGEGFGAQQIIYGDFTHITILNARSLAQVLELAGFRAISVSEAGPVPITKNSAARAAAWALARRAVRLARSVETGRRAEVLTENMIGIGVRPQP